MLRHNQRDLTSWEQSPTFSSGVEMAGPDEYTAMNHKYGDLIVKPLSKYKSIYRSTLDQNCSLEVIYTVLKFRVL